MPIDNSGLKHPVAPKMRIHYDRWRVIPLVFVILFFSLFSLIGLWRHWGYLTSINDLGCFDQVAWMASNGHTLVNTSNFNMPINWLAFRFHPVLFVFGFLYKITPTVNWFIFAQAAALAVSVYPVYLIAERITASGKVALMWSLAYLCNPFILSAAAWDFHPVSLAVPFLALGLLAIERKQLVLLMIACIALITCKEHMGLIVAGLGLLYGVRNRAWTMGLGIFLSGITLFVLIVMVVMPSYSLTGQHSVFGENVGYLGRYTWLGESPLEALKKIAFEPMSVIQTIITMGGLKYLFDLLIPLLFLPLAGMLWLLPASADLLVNLLSANPLPRSIFSYHSVTLIPVLLVAAIHGSQKLSRSMEWFTSEKFAMYILLVNIFLGYVHAPLPFPGSINIWGPVKTIANFDKKETIVRDVIGDASASVQANIGAHFSQRTLIYRYPEKVGEAEFVVLRLENPSKRSITLPHLILMDPEEYLDSVSKLLDGKYYGVAYWDDPWLILQRDHESDESSGKILMKIEKLRSEWIDS